MSKFCEACNKAIDVGTEEAGFINFNEKSISLQVCNDCLKIAGRVGNCI